MLLVSSPPGKTLYCSIGYWHTRAPRRSALPRERFGGRRLGFDYAHRFLYVGDVRVNLLSRPAKVSKLLPGGAALGFVGFTA